MPSFVLISLVVDVNPTYQLLVNNQDLSKYLEHDTWTVTQNFGRQGTTATLQLMDDFGNGLPNIFPRGAQQVIFKDTSINQTLFAGYASQISLASYAPSANEWMLDCTDYTTRADNIIVSGDFYGLSADTIIKTLVAQAHVGLSTNNVQAGPTLGRVQINYLTLSQALTKIATLASQTTDYSWYLDYSRDVHFFSLEQTASPVVTFTDNQALTSSLSQTLGFYSAEDSAFQYIWDVSTLRNSCIVRGGNYTGIHTDRFVGNGQQRAWPLTFNVDTSVQSPTMTVNGITTSISIVQQGGSNPSNTPAYVVMPNAAGQWFLQTNPFGGATITPVKGAVLQLSYGYIAPIITRVDNQTSQATYDDGTGGGVYQTYLADPTLANLTAATQRGQSELQEYQWAQERVQFTSVDAWPGHINAGQVIQFVSGRVPNSQTGSLGITGNFLIVQNTISGTKGNYRTYQILATRIT